MTRSMLPGLVRPPPVPAFASSRAPDARTANRQAIASICHCRCRLLSNDREVDLLILSPSMLAPIDAARRSFEEPSGSTPRASASPLRGCYKAQLASQVVMSLQNCLTSTVLPGHSRGLLLW